MSSIKHISVRDNVNKVNSIYLREDNTKTAVSTYDPGIWSKEIYKITKQDSETVGLGIMLVPHVPKNQLIEFWEKIIILLEKRNIKWQMFCNGHEEDYMLANIYLLKCK